MMIMYICLAASSVICLYVWLRLRSVFRLSRTPAPAPSIVSDDDLPSVSLCIPARNEVHAMTDCLESALRSSYPKLEIIVLDDASRDETSTLIKSFAHAGVRFVEGSPLPDGWLGKNHALDALTQQASGSLLLFADVDTRFAPKSISQLVDIMTHESADMISVLPTRYNPMRASAMLATLRHFWNLLLHSNRHPAVASSAWMIKRSLLVDSLHGFSDVASDVRPEKSIASLVSQSGIYRFVISTKQLGVSYEKKLSSQHETAIRIYYPDFGLGGIVVRILGLLVVLSPYLILVMSLIMQDLVLAGASLMSIVLVSLVNAWYLSVLRSNSNGLVSLCLPYILVREVYLLAASIVQYKLHTVTWKGRAVQATTRR